MRRKSAVLNQTAPSITTTVMAFIQYLKIRRASTCTAHVTSDQTGGLLKRLRKVILFYLV